MSEVLADANIGVTITRVNKTPTGVMLGLQSLNTSVLKFLFCMEEKCFHILSLRSDPEPSEAQCPHEP